MSKTGSFLVSKLLVLLSLTVSCVPKSGPLHFEEIVSPSSRLNTQIQENLQIGDRDFVRSVLIQAFDLTESDTTAMTTLNGSITGSLGFGATCDPYAGVRRLVPPTSGTNYGLAYDYPERSCIPGTEPAPSSNSTRNGYLYGVCNSLILPDTSKWNAWGDKVKAMGLLLRIMKKIDSNFVLIENNAKVPDRFKPDADSIKKAYRLFHVIRDPDPRLIDALLILANETKEMSTDNTKTYWDRSWQYILFSLCTDPEWQAVSI
jgi:hypothetical protein